MSTVVDIVECPALLETKKMFTPLFNKLDMWVCLKVWIAVY